jgi:hypothetical protein
MFDQQLLLNQFLFDNRQRHRRHPALDHIHFLLLIHHRQQLQDTQLHSHQLEQSKFLML